VINGSHSQADDILSCADELIPGDPERFMTNIAAGNLLEVGKALFLKAWGGDRILFQDARDLGRLRGDN
jgi:hypothetical protein